MTLFMKPGLSRGIGPSMTPSSSESSGLACEQIDFGETPVGVAADDYREASDVGRVPGLPVRLVTPLHAAEPPVLSGALLQPQMSDDAAASKTSGVPEVAVEIAVMDYLWDIQDRFSELFQHVKIEGPRQLETVDSSAMRGRPTIGIVYDMVESMMIAAHGQRAFPDANFVVIPNLPRCFFIEGDRVFAERGALLRWNGSEALEMRGVVFNPPLPLDLHYTMLNLGEVFEGAIYQRGIPATNTSFVRQLTADKWRTQVLFNRYGIRTPRGAIMPCGQNLTIGQLKEWMERFLRQKGVTDFVVKPNQGSLGIGVRMFEEAEIDEAAAFVHDTGVHASESSLIQERIRSFPLIVEGRRMDWNIRVVVPPGDLDAWNPEDTSEVRYSAYGSRPVNTYQGAKVMELAAAFERLGLPEEQWHRIRDELKRLSKKIRSSLHQQLIADHGGQDMKDRRGRSYFGSALLGLDVILDEQGDLSCLEINAGVVGGMASLAAIREGDGKWRAVRDLTSALVEIANDEWRHARPVGDVSGARISYDGHALSRDSLGLRFQQPYQPDDAGGCSREALEQERVSGRPQFSERTRQTTLQLIGELQAAREGNPREKGT